MLFLEELVETLSRLTFAFNSLIAIELEPTEPLLLDPEAAEETKEATIPPREDLDLRNSEEIELEAG